MLTPRMKKVLSFKTAGRCAGERLRQRMWNIDPECDGSGPGNGRRGRIKLCAVRPAWYNGCKDGYKDGYYTTLAQRLAVIPFRYCFIG